MPAKTTAAKPTAAESDAWTFLAASALDALLCCLPVDRPIGEPARKKAEAEAATIADEMMEHWRARFAA